MLGGEALNHINSFQIYKLDCVISIHNYYAFDVQKQQFSLCCHLVGNIDIRCLNQSSCLQKIIQMHLIWLFTSIYKYGGMRWYGTKSTKAQHQITTYYKTGVIFLSQNQITSWKTVNNLLISF